MKIHVNLSASVVMGDKVSNQASRSAGQESGYVGGLTEYDMCKYMKS